MQFEYDPSRRRAERPDWLPDWKDEASYAVRTLPDETALPMSEWGPIVWAWQFLRRNPEYWADWRQFAALPDTIVSDGGASVKSAKWTDTYLVDTPMQYFHAEQPVVWGETVGQYEARTGETPELLRVYLERKWGIGFLYDPAKGLPAFLEPHPDISWEMPLHFAGGERLNDYLGRAMGYDFLRRLPQWAREQIEQHDEIVYSFQVEEETGTALEVVGFDLRYGLDPQIGQAKRYLAERHKAAHAKDSAFQVGRVTVEPSPAQRKKLPGLLRAYDAVWSGATSDEAAAILYRRPRGDIPDSAPRNVQEDVSKAKRLIREGFRRLLTLAVWG